MLATLSQPYAIAGRTLMTSAIATYEALTSEKAQCIYKDIYTITSVVVQVTALLLYAAGLYTVIAGRKCRAYYEAEWAADVERFLTYPDRCLVDVDAAGEPVDSATTGTETVQPAMPATVQAILESNAKTTEKLRAIATHFDIPWRNARGEGKHMLNTDIKAALSRHREVLRVL
jgi:hypothetical protein